MTQHVAKVWLMKSRFEGYPQLSDFAIREEVLPPLKDGGVCVCVCVCVCVRVCVCLDIAVFGQTNFESAKNIPEYLVQAVWFSVDPYNRTVAARADFSEGMAMKGFQVAR